MKTKKYFIVSFLALLAAGCQDYDMGGGTAAQPGDEVTFSVSLGENTATRTAYGALTENNGNYYYPINWVSNDRVIIASPECDSAGGDPTATYTVTPASNNATTGYLSPYSSGDSVKWGTEDFATFYSFYPASRATFNTNDYSTVTLTVPTHQTIQYYSDGSIIYPMDRACFMYAKTTGNRWNTVDLTYVPISTALRFTLQRPTGSNSINVTQVTVIANTNIAGTFTTNLKDASVTEDPTSVTAPTLNGGTYDYIDVLLHDYAVPSVPVTYVTMSAGQTLEVNVGFLLAGTDSISLSGWIIEIEVDYNATRYTYTKTLGGNVNLERGKIHNLGTLTLDF